MGQRHQIFIRVANPLKNETFLNSVADYDKDGKKLKRAKRIFGNKETSILPYHHQWLYGASATAILYKLMKNVVEAKGTDHPFSAEFNNLPYPKAGNKALSALQSAIGKQRDSIPTKAYEAIMKEAQALSNKQRIEGYFELLDGIINFQDNVEFGEIARYGVESAFYIGEECYNEKGVKEFGDIRTNCTWGDNNDGIMIVDTITKKYCFMNISETEKNSDSVYSLPSMTPVSAVEYASAYYPTTKATLSQYTKDEGDVKETLARNIEVVKIVEKFTEQFQVLSLKELAEIFPQNFKTKKAKK